MKTILGLCMMMAIAACSSKLEKKPQTPASLPTTLSEAVTGPLRSTENLKRDMYRHPLETLTFFGLKPEMNVIEIWPSGGWYTEILSPFLVTNGKYTIADPEADPNGYTTKRKDWLARNPEISSKVGHTTFQPGKTTDIAPENSVDMVLTFRNVHNWLPVKSQEAAFRTFYKALKPGGVLGVVEHRAHAKKKFNPKSGYVKESEVVRLAIKAGFKLEAKSEINSNPKDLRDYKDGVWTLPPTLKQGEKDRDKYLAIGESDRMTLKFVKPVKK